MTVVAAVLAVLLAVQTVRLRAALTEGTAARDVAVSSLLVAAAASEEARRRGEALAALGVRAREIEREVAVMAERECDRLGDVSPGGYRLIVAAGQLMAAVREVQDGEVRG